MAKKYLLILPLLVLMACSPKKPSSPIPDVPIINKKQLQEMTEDELRAYAKEFAKKTIITDGHVDLPYRMKVAGFMLKKEVMDVSQRTDGNFDYPKSIEGGLDAPFMSIYVPSSYQTTGSAKTLADSLISMVEKLPAAFPDKFVMAYRPDDVMKNFGKGLVSLPMGMENGAPLENDLANVAYFYNKGIRYITLTHSKDNQICDSSYDNVRTWNGLSPFGKKVIEEMNRVGIMVDVSHISDSAFYQVMDLSKVPVIASHSSARHFTPRFERNMSDDMIKLLAQKGGVIQINFGSSFLAESSRAKFNEMRAHVINYLAENNLKRDDAVAQAYIKSYIDSIDPFATVEIVADHIDHVVSIAGIDCVGFGSDYDGVGDTLPTGLKDVSEYPNLIFELFKRGYSEEDLEKICHKNVFRVWNETLAYAGKI